MITLNELTKYWDNLSLNQKLSLLKRNGIETIAVYHLSKDRYIRRSINYCDSINFDELDKTHQERILNYFNTQPAKFKTKKPTSEIQAEFNLEIDKKTDIYD